MIQKQSNYKYAAILEISGNSKENTVKEGFHYWSCKVTAYNSTKKDAVVGASQAIFGYFSEKPLNNSHLYLLMHNSPEMLKHILINLHNILQDFSKYVWLFWGYALNIKGFMVRDLVPFAQFNKREKHPRRSVTFSLFHGCFSCF